MPELRKKGVTDRRRYFVWYYGIKEARRYEKMKLFNNEI